VAWEQHLVSPPGAGLSSPQDCFQASGLYHRMVPCQMAQVYPSHLNPFLAGERMYTGVGDLGFGDRFLGMEGVFGALKAANTGSLSYRHQDKVMAQQSLMLRVEGGSSAWILGAGSCIDQKQPSRLEVD